VYSRACYRVRVERELCELGVKCSERGAIVREVVGIGVEAHKDETEMFAFDRRCARVLLRG